MADEATTDKVDPQDDLEEEAKVKRLRHHHLRPRQRILQRPKTPIPIMNVSHWPSREREEQSSEEKVPLQEEIP